MSDLLKIVIAKAKGVLASKWYVINSTLSDAAGHNVKPYYFSIYINGHWYYYESDYPFYIVENDSNYYIIFAYGCTARASDASPKSANYSFGNNFGIKNGITYYEETYARSSIIQSKQDIYIWRA